MNDKLILDERIDWQFIDFSSTLPETHHTYTVPNLETWPDQNHFSVETVDYLTSKVRCFIPHKICPFRVPEDGNCLLHCISLAIWGVKKNENEKLLRHFLWSELEQNRNFYKNAPSKFSEDEVDYEQILSSAKAPNAFLEFIHIFALSNVIKRPIIVYASDEDVQSYGVKEHGVSAMFLPTRHGASSCCGRPLALAWSESNRNHFVPLLPVTSEEKTFEWPFEPLAYSNTLAVKESIEDYIRNGIQNSLLLNFKEQEDMQVCAKLMKEPPEEEQIFDTVIFFVVSDFSSQHLQQLGVHFHEPYRTSTLRLFVSMKRRLNLPEIESVEKIIQRCVKNVKENPHKIITKQYRPIHKSRYLTFETKLPSTYSIYPNAPYEKILEKILGTNSTLSSIEPDLGISPDQVTVLTNMVKELQKTTDYSATVQNDALEVMSQLLTWGGEEAFPVIHLASIVILQKSVANYFHSIQSDTSAITASLIGKIVQSSRKLTYSLRIVTLKFFSNIFFQEPLLDILVNLKLPLLQQIEICLSQEIGAFEKKYEEITLTHIANILLNFAIYWKDIKRDFEPHTLHFIAVAKVLNILFTILNSYQNYNEIILKVLLLFGTIIQIEGDTEMDLNVLALIQSFLKHSDPNIQRSAQYIAQLFNAPTSYTLMV